MSQKEKAWGQLVCTTDLLPDPILIRKNKCLIGRSKACDVCLVGNKMVSGTHCYIEREKDGTVWLQDTSTNGTLLNLTKKLTGTRSQLNHGDELAVVYRKSQDVNVAYVFQDTETLRREELDSTQEYSTNVTSSSLTEEASEEEEPVGKRKASPEPESTAPKSKKAKLKTSQEAHYLEEKSTHVEAAEQAGKKKEAKASHSTPGAPGKQTSGSASGVSPGDGKSAPGATTAECQEDVFEDTLVCIICQEILHDCISVQPCLHSFCAGCYSDWMTRSLECPSCRSNVERVNKNHLVNNLVEAYLKKHPDKKRPEDVIKALDAKSKVAKDSFKPPKPKKTLSAMIDEDDDEADEEDVEEDEGFSNSEEYGDSDAGDGGIVPPIFTAPLSFNTIKAPKTVCRQCPEYKAPAATAGTGVLGGAVAAVGSAVSKVFNMVTGKDDATGYTSTAPSGEQEGTAAGTADKPSTSGAGDVAGPKAPPYKCSPTQVHILCQCCLQAMPDQRTDASTDKLIPPQQCAMCYRFFCHSYWGCQKVGCAGCLGRMKDMNYAQMHLQILILNNQYESDIFKNYLESKSKTYKDVLLECCVKLDAEEISCMDQPRGLNSKTVVCYACGLRNFQDMAYQYRKSLSKEDLPAAVTGRPDCYWGKNCRTQRGKMHHAAHYNHICDQTRT